MDIDTTERHKAMLCDEIVRLRRDLSSVDVDYTSVCVHLLSLISRLLGFDYQRAHLNTPVYFQTEDQRYTQIIMEGGDVIQHHFDGKNIVLERRKLIELLKAQGLSKIRIAQILNITPYQITKIEKEL